MDIVYKDGTKITEEEVTGLLIALLFAGQHTSCTTSTWTTLFILHNPEILKRVINERQTVFGTGDEEKEELDLDGINSLELLHNCMREALRMCPTFIMLLRKVMKDTKIMVDDPQNPNGKQVEKIIPKGDTVVVSPTVSMRLETTFKNANTFDPDRFGPGREEHKQPYAYLGFGGGMHSCMGQVFAYVQVKTILTVLFRDYDLKLDDPTKLPDIGYNDMVVGPKGNRTVHYTKKEKKA